MHNTVAADYHKERNHQSLVNRLLFPDKLSDSGDVACRKRLGGLLNYYYRKAG